MEMTRLWKSQNDFHSRLKISLENARFSHSHSRSAFSDEKRRPENERYEVNHVPHTEFLTLPALTAFLLISSSSCQLLFKKNVLLIS